MKFARKILFLFFLICMIFVIANISALGETNQTLNVTLGVPYMDSQYVQYYGTVYYVMFDANVMGGEAPFTYVFEMKRDGEVIYTSSASSSKTFRSNTGYTGYTTYLDPVGLYTATVTVTDNNGITAFAMSDGYYLRESGHHSIGVCCPSC